MAQSTRLFGAYISTVLIGGVSFVAVCESLDIEYQNDTQMATALKDAWKYPVGIRGEWSATGKFFISTAATAGEGGPGGTLWTLALTNTQVAFSAKDNAIVGAGNTLSGNALIISCNQNIGDNAQTITIKLTGQGPLASVIA